MATNTYDIGDLVRIASAFTTHAGAAVDPTAVTARVKDPSGTVTVFTYPATVAKDATGSYHADFVPTLPGVHHYRWEGTGAAVAASESFFYVQASAVV
jgi:hypothetical protein